MRVVPVRNVHAGLPAGLHLLSSWGVSSPSRNGPVRVLPEPVTTVLTYPTERVLFWPLRDCNPFFHLYEALWMLDGRNDVASVGGFARQMFAYSDDGQTLHGAYGKRWRSWFGIDQLKIVIDMLRNDPHSRRAVVQMWDAKSDLGRGGKDVPCNTMIYPSINPLNGRLDMSVLCRSNDIVWGLYGANAVHFSVLQEYLAAHLGLLVGHMTTVSNNFHIYEDWADKLSPLLLHAPDPYRTVAPGCYYSCGDVAPFPLVEDPLRFDRELRALIDAVPGLDPEAPEAIPSLGEPFLQGTAVPMFLAHRAWKKRTTAGWLNKALAYASWIQASDWRLAATQWLDRRAQKEAEKNG